MLFDVKRRYGISHGDALYYFRRYSFWRYGAHYDLIWIWVWERANDYWRYQRHVFWYDYGRDIINSWIWYDGLLLRSQRPDLRGL